MDKMIDSLIELIRCGNINIVSEKHDDNPHIIRFGFLSKDEQIECLNHYNGSEEVCIYPSTFYLEQHRDVSGLELKPYEKQMALGYPQLRACYFEYDVLLHYAFDPRMNFKFNDYQGHIKSKSDVDKRRFINLESFGIGRNGEEVIIVAFPRDLRKMSTMNQMIWSGYQIHKSDNCRTLRAYLDNSLKGCWNFPQTVFRSILQEISNINKLTKEAFSEELFKKTFEKNEIENFDLLSFPSLNTYNEFLLLLEKVVIGNIKNAFFKETISIDDDNNNKKGTLACLKEWITRVNPEVCDDIYEPLHKVRKLRQKPAHEISNNLYSHDFLKKQLELCDDVYKSLNLLRRLIQTHPKVKDLSLDYPETQYIKI